MTTEAITWSNFPQPVEFKGTIDKGDVVAVRINNGDTTKPEGYSRWSGATEELRQGVISIARRMALPLIAGIWAGGRGGAVTAFAAGSTEGAEKLRSGFEQIIDVFTAVAEPILWFYALIGCIMMATGRNKEKGWDRLKQVGYGYLAIALLPTAFKMLHWLANILQGAMQF